MSAAGLARESAASIDFGRLFEQSPGGIAVLSGEGSWLRVNRALRERLGYAEGELVGRSILEVMHPEDAGAFADQLRGLLAGETPTLILEARFRHRDAGLIGGLRVSAAVMRDRGRAPPHVVVQTEELTDVERVDEGLSRERLRQLYDAQALAKVGSWERDLSQPRAVLSAELCRILGQRPGFAPTLEEYVALVHEEERGAVLAALLAAGKGQAGESEYRIVRPDGEIRHIHARRTPRVDGEGRVTHLFGAVQDVTERKRYEDRLEMLATHDPLTGLPNRRTFDERIVSELARARRHDRPLCLALLDVDRFKQINDTLGHPAGDHVLAGVAGVLRDHIRGDEVIARVGGEEFAWILPDADTSGARAAVTRCLAAVAAARFEGVPTITVSAGVCAARDELDVGELYRRADNALLAAKHGGRNRLVVADGERRPWGSARPRR
jgi:diguanylate cyclase (GGDEF)-like protein/PAS domain S-box-containing protein